MKATAIVAEDPITTERIIVDPFCALVDAEFLIEKVRVQAQVRLAHLVRNGRADPDGEELFTRVGQLEKWLDGRISTLLKGHPAYPWFSRVKGIGNENIAKILGPIDIERAQTISALWKFAGYAPTAEGKAMKRTKGEKLPYNSQLRVMCWRLGSSLLRAKGAYYMQYLAYKEGLQQRSERQGIRIVPATDLPKQEGKRYEPDDMLAEGHIHMMAMRKMIKLFLAHLWLVWREAKGLPTRCPYAHEYQGHSTFVSPEDMVDR